MRFTTLPADDLRGRWAGMFWAATAGYDPS